MRDLRESLRLYLVADPEACSTDRDFVGAIANALVGGVTMVQLRNKIWPDEQARKVALHLVGICRKARVPFIVNDRVDIALETGADGVHLGVNDMPIEDARLLALQRDRSDFIIGYSPESDDDLQTARTRGSDYLGIGPVFATRTKVDAGNALGLDEFTRRIDLGGLPVVGIGGINHQNYKSVLAAGADGIAVVSAIMAADDPQRAADQLSTN